MMVIMIIDDHDKGNENGNSNSNGEYLSVVDFWGQSGAVPL